MDVLSLKNPEKPTLMTRLNSNSFNKVHEVFVKNDTAYCSAENAGLFIYNMKDSTNPKLIGSISPPYPENGYNHSSWLDSSGKYLMFTDEVPFGLGIKVYDVHDLSAPDFVTVFNSNKGATPHNAYWKNRFAYVSAYEDGLQIFDMKNPQKLSVNNRPPIAGYFDTYMLNTTGVYNGFHGCWGVWPFLPSGVILVSDISEGLFVLETSATLSATDNKSNIIFAKVFPNPFIHSIKLGLTAMRNEVITVTLYSVEGKQVQQSTHTIQMGTNEIELTNIDYLKNGLYQLNITGTFSVLNRTVLKSN